MTAYVVVVIFVATLIRSTLGFGEALVAVPLLSLVLPVTIATPLAVLVSIVVAGAVVLQDGRHIDVRSAAGLVAAAIVGIPVGLLLLVKADDHVVKAILGTIIVAFSVHALLQRARAPIAQADRGWLAMCGFLSGVLGGAYGMNGPPLVLYGARRGWSPQQFRATLQGYFLPVSTIGTIGYAATGVWTLDVTRHFLWSLPGVLVATAIGRAINTRMPGHAFVRFVHASLILIGAVLVAQALRR